MIRFLKNRQANNKGTTLVELIIYMGILAILIYILTDILSSILNVQVATQSNAHVTTDGRYIYSRIIYDVNRAQSVSSPANLGDSSDRIDLVINATNYSVYLSGDSLVISDDTGIYQLNGPDTEVSDLQFTRIGNVSGKHTFKIDFKVTSKIMVNSQYDSETFQTTAGLR